MHGETLKYEYKFIGNGTSANV